MEEVHLTYSQDGSLKDQAFAITGTSHRTRASTINPATVVGAISGAVAFEPLRERDADHGGKMDSVDELVVDSVLLTLFLQSLVPNDD